MSGVGKANGLPNNEANRNKVLEYYRRNAGRRKLSWGLSVECFTELIAADCFYCGDVPTRIVRHQHCVQELICNGIDRLKSTDGYVEGNVVPCCWDCNRMKAAMSVENFKRHISKIYRHSIGVAIGAGE
jgi:hypothetical protein